MYVTRPLSLYQKFPNAVSKKPEGRNSGFLVIQDEESEAYCCYGSCKKGSLNDLPIPQNKKLTVEYVQSTGHSVHVTHDDVVLVPVLDFPLASNRYYAVKPHGKHKGEAITCSKEEDMKNCCFCRCVKDVKPRPLDPRNIYQQVEINNCKTICGRKGYFNGKSVAEDGFPPYFLRRSGWSILTKTPRNYKLEEALGINAALRASLPDFNFPASYNTSDAVLVGRWYTPFMFITDCLPLKDQLEQSTFYEISLEQRWEKIYSHRNNNYDGGKSVHVDATIDTESASVFGNKAWWDDENVVDGTVYFKGLDKSGEEKTLSIIGLRSEVVERMKWEQERGGWSGGKERQERVARVEHFVGGNKGDWSMFSCYILVESFAVRRMDGSLIMTYDFRHTHQIRSKWE